MIDYVTAPTVKKSTAGSPFHSFEVQKIKKHVEASGVPRKKSKVSSTTIARRLTLASKGIPFANPPTQCALYGVTYLSAPKTLKCIRFNCPLIPHQGGNHSWLIFTQFD